MQRVVLKRILSISLLVAGYFGLGALGVSEGALGREPSWRSLIPIAVTLLIAFGSRNAAAALGAGVLAGAALTYGPAGLPSALKRYVWDNVSDPWHLFIAGFALLMLAMIRLLEASGATAKLVHALTRRVRGRQGAQLATVLAGFGVFFDDYANTFVVGSSMRPVTDRFGVSREKLAYLVDSTAAPIAAVAVVSTWISYEAGLLQSLCGDHGVACDGYALVLAAIPYRLYSLTSLGLVLLTAVLGRDVGPMLLAERKARRLATPSPQAETDKSICGWQPALVVSLPLTVLLLALAAGYVYDGGGIVPTSLSAWQQCLQNARHGAMILCVAAGLATVTALLLTVGTRMLSMARATRALSQGFTSALPPLAILFGAWALGSIAKDLHSGRYLATLTRDTLSATYLPLATFSLAAFISFATGSSWGTMALLLPVAFPLAAGAPAPTLIATVAAVMDGSIFGDHCSPLSDTTILSATACECPLLAHTRTQLPYALAAVSVAAAGYLVVSLNQAISTGVVLVCGLGLLGVWLWRFGQAP